MQDHWWVEIFDAHEIYSVIRIYRNPAKVDEAFPFVRIAEKNPLKPSLALVVV